MRLVIHQLFCRGNSFKVLVSEFCDIEKEERSTRHLKITKTVKKMLICEIIQIYLSIKLRNHACNRTTCLLNN